jgi:hypothetical protein
MVYSLKITSSDGSTVSVDMTNLHPTYSFSGSNPVAIIPPPTPDTASATAYNNTNAVGINLGMMLSYADISFISYDGIGDYDMTSLTTNHKKLKYLFENVKDYKRLYINSTTNYARVHILNYRATNAAGQKDIVTHNLTCVFVGADSM